MSEAPKTVWVTKWVPDEPISECRVLGFDDDGLIHVRWRHGWAHKFWPDDWHPTREAAVARANEMKVAKIASLKRQIAKLEALEF